MNKYTISYVKQFSNKEWKVGDKGHDGLHDFIIINEPKVRSIVATRGTEWKSFLGDFLPEGAKKYADINKTFNSHGGSWMLGCVFYKGDIDTTTDWIIVTDDGGYYHCFAKYMIWYNCSTGKGVAEAIWTKKTLKLSLKSLITIGETTHDPKYQT